MYGQNPLYASLTSPTQLYPSYATVKGLILIPRRHKDMTILIADVNVSPSLESNSLLFRAAAHSGLSHTSFLRQLVTNSCTRQGIEPPLLLPVEPIETSVLAPLVQSPVSQALYKYLYPRQAPGLPTYIS